MKLLVLSLLFFAPLLARAQMDASSAVLLRPSGRTGPTPQSLDNSRYKIREKAKSEEYEEEPGTLIASPVPKSSKTKVEPPLSTPPPPPEPAPPLVVVEEARPPVTVQVRELILGGSSEDIDDAKKQIHPEDPRANILNISLAPAYYYEGSSSNYTFRNYHTDGPGLGLGMNVWLTPFFGVQSKYFASVSSAVNDGAGNAVPISNQDFAAGIRFRRHFGYTRRSAQLSWGIDYHDSKANISPEAKNSIGQKASGLSVALEGEIPMSINYSHLFELAIRPYQHESELATSVTAKSGTHNTSNAVGLAIGGQWTLDRRNQIFWKGQYSIEKTIYDGSASEADPRSGTTPTGVGVTNSTAIFYFGFKWGS